MRIYRMFFTLVLFLGLGLALAPAPTAWAAGGIISGTVTDVNGKPVENVRVSAYQYNTELGGWFAQVWTQTVVTGKYDLTGLQPGVYRVEFAAPGIYLTEYYDNVSAVEYAQDLAVHQDETVSPINAQLAPVGHIVGRVTNEDGQPLPDVQVNAYRDLPGLGWYDVSFAVVDAQGNYDLSGLDPGSYRVRFIDPANRYFTEFYVDAPTLASADDIAVGVSEIVKKIDAQLTRVDKPRITIVKDTQPDSRRNFLFAGDLGEFRLDDMRPEDGDGHNRHRSFEVDPGLYRVYERQAGRWQLADITCDPAANGAVDVLNNQVAITVSGSEHVTCTFTNQKYAIIRTRVYHDLNGDGGRHHEPGLLGWTITVYESTGGALATGVTNAFGKVNFNSMRAGYYTVCETLQAGWYSTQPGNLPNIEPCYPIYVGPGEIAVLDFGNSTSPPLADAQVNRGAGWHIELASDSADEDDEAAFVDEDLNQPVEERAIYLPVIRR